jgi:hypothetical protein
MPCSNEFSSIYLANILEIFNKLVLPAPFFFSSFGCEKMKNIKNKKGMFRGNLFFEFFWGPHFGL